MFFAYAMLLLQDSALPRGRRGAVSVGIVEGCVHTRRFR